MSRDWLAVYVGILHRAKYRKLSLESRAGLLHVWCHAGTQTTEATWPDRRALQELLELDGYPPSVVDELIERTWLDVDEGGRILVHDWDQWQQAATKAAQDAYEADRKRDWRRRVRQRDQQPKSVGGDPLPPAPPSPDIKGSTQLDEKTTQESREVPDKSRDVPDARPIPMNGRAKVPTEGPCRTCGGHLTDTDYGARVGPGWIEHSEHPKEWAS